MLRDHLLLLVLKASRRLDRLAGRGFAGRRSLPIEAAAAARFLPASGAIVVDGGANKGDWCRELLRIAGPRIERIYAFEPVASHHPSIASLGEPRIEIIGAALSDAARAMQLYAHQPGASIASLHERDLRHLGLEIVPQHDVTSATVDGFIRERGLDRIDFLKLDIEGHELQALRGAQGALESGVIRALSFEFGGCNIDSRSYLRDFWHLLSPDYDLYIINPLTTTYRIAEYNEWWECFLTTNFIAVRKGGGSR